MSSFFPFKNRYPTMSIFQIGSLDLHVSNWHLHVSTMDPGISILSRGLWMAAFPYIYVGIWSDHRILVSAITYPSFRTPSRYGISMNIASF